jgi:protein phosphatase
MIVCAKSEKGSLHPNEDAILVDLNKKILGVADGVTLSDYGSGKKAAELILSLIQKNFESDLKKAFEKSLNEFRELKLKDREIGETTLAICRIGAEVECLNVGDSDIFLIRNEKIIRVSEKDKFGRYLTQVIGLYEIKPHYSKLKVEKGDKILLVTDGVSDVLNENEILEIVLKSKNVEEMVEKILEETNKKPKIYDDDKSIVAVWL